MDENSQTEKIKALAAECGADLVGIADLSLLKDIFAHPPTLLTKYKYAISLAVNLQKYDRYDNTTEDRAFSTLEKIAVSLKGYIENKGYRVEVVPPDERVGNKEPLIWKGAISHKAVARAAGLGWIGKSMLLITPQYGPRVCLATILTDMPLTPNKPVPNQCGNCVECVKACPVNALTEASFADHPKNLAQVLLLKKCAAWIDKTWDEGRICYECMLACPWGKLGTARNTFNHYVDVQKQTEKK